MGKMRDKKNEKNIKTDKKNLVVLKLSGKNKVLELMFNNKTKETCCF